MKNSFPEFDPGTELDCQKIWDSALFVFDTNVLLNLYRYQASTRDQLLEVLEKLSERIWVPHHVALEFQRNRLTVLAGQNRRFVEVRNVIDGATSGLNNELGKLQLERRHTLIDPTPLLEGFEKLAEEFLRTLDGIQQGQQKLSEPDSLKSRIEDLFDGRVGDAPTEQKQIDEIYKLAEERFSSEIPPGFMDAKKDRKGPTAYVHRGIYYQRKYGDYLVWHQLLEHSKNAGADTVVFVTDDAKDDWWWRIKSDAPKTLGPRPELQDEAARVGGITHFKMYRPEGFMTSAKKYLKTEVSNETLEEVRDVSSLRREMDAKQLEFFRYAKRGERAVLHWLEGRFPRVTANKYSFPDFTVELDGRVHGIDVKAFRGRNAIGRRLRDWLNQGYFETGHSEFATVTLVLLLPSLDEALESIGFLKDRPDILPRTVSVVVAVLTDDGSQVPDMEFVQEFVGEKGSSLFRLGG